MMGLMWLLLLEWLRLLVVRQLRLLLAMLLLLRRHRM